VAVVVCLGLLVSVPAAVAGAAAAGGGTWGTAQEVPGAATLNHGDAEVETLSCAAVGNCSGGGYYTDGHGLLQAFVVGETNGSWGTAQEVPGTAALNKGQLAEVNSLSCAAPGASLTRRGAVEPGEVVAGYAAGSRGLTWLFVDGGLPVLDSGCPRATQPPGRWQHGRHAPATREADEPPRAADLPGAAKLMGAPGRSSMGVKLPGPFGGDGLGNHRVHDILLACGTTLFGRLH
jgi:hypothetical protein